MIIFLHTFGHIFIPIILILNTVKGKDMYNSNWIYVVEYCIYGGNLFFYANVAASMRQEIMFHPKVCLELKSGQILTSECDCEASEAGQCGHVAALLFCLLDLFAKPKPKPLKVKKACTETVNTYPYFISRKKGII